MEVDSGSDRGVADSAGRDDSGDALAGLELAAGEISGPVARIYARVPARTGLNGAWLSGELIGPHSELARTLPARYRFLPLRRGAAEGTELVAEAVVPEPCRWSPESPFLYTARVEYHAPGGDGGGGEVRHTERTTAIRSLGVRGRSLYLNEERNVLRGAMVERADEGTVRAAKEVGCSFMARNPDDAACAAASRLGVWIVAVLDEHSDEGSRSDLAADLRRLARWPAVAAVVVSLAGERDLDLGYRGGMRPLIAERYRGSPISGASQLLLCDARPSAEMGRAIAAIGKPVMMLDTGSTPTAWPEIRRAVDRWQAEWAEFGDFAGYFVGLS